MTQTNSPSGRTAKLKDDALKPCPFCGGDAASFDDSSYSTVWEIGCYNGQCAVEPHVWETTKEQAIAAWNRRADLEATASQSIASTPQDARVTALVEALRNVVEEYHRFRNDEYERGLSPLDDEIHDASAALAAFDTTDTGGKDE